MLLVTAPTQPPLFRFFDNFLDIFHKTEVQIVNLRCWKCLNLNRFKSYNTKCKCILPDMVTHEMINGLSTTISSHSFNNYLHIFPKTEVQTVILRCWTGVDPNLFKSYDTKCKWGQLLIDDEPYISSLKSLWSRLMLYFEQNTHQ